MAQLRIHVTADDIAKAEREKTMKCVVARAIARSVPGATRVEVDLQSIRWTTKEGDRWIYLTPPVVQGYVIDFDAGESIEPFMFALDSRHRLPAARKYKSTPAGKAVDKARHTNASAQKKLARATGASRKAASEEAERAEVNLATVRAAYKGAVRRERVNDSTRPALPRLHKSGGRWFGVRQLRANQDTPAD